ncbi:alginate export family protein [Gilvimarinus agarilyticus]|uniref:alginate export family protein n=1 Tax=Gilvimarinus agarilyticus TaxID=679259 RepID=UPI0005A0D397|nr:alginate export family protein [Gilvimarinus agarilyticus]
MSYGRVLLTLILVSPMLVCAQEVELLQSEQGSGLGLHHKLTAQVGYGPGVNPIGGDETDFSVLRYAPALSWFGSDQTWPEWEVYSRIWLSYSSNGASNPVFEGEQSTPEGESAEWRDFYVRRNRLFGQQGLTLTLGRQRFSSELGLWWDTSIESMNLSWQGEKGQGFVAFGSRFDTYNTELKELDPREESIVYLLSEYAYEFSALQKVGVRFMVENDESDPWQEDDRFDIDAYRAGLFLSGRDLLNSVISDYHLEFVGLAGDVSELAPSGDNENYDMNGWAFAGEVGKDFRTVAWSPRVAFRVGATDKSTGEGDGFYLNAIQTDRINVEGTYSSAMTGSFVALTMSNALFYGVRLELEPRVRQRLDVMVSDVYCHSRDGQLPITRTRTTDSCDERSVGQMVDLNYVWDMYPTVVSARRLDWRVMFNLGYFNAGSAIKPRDSEGQVLLSTEISF